MDDIEKILERLEKLEKSINGLKEELHDLKEHEDDQEEGYNRDAVRDIFSAFNNVYSMAHEIRRQMKHVFRPYRRSRRQYYGRDDDSGFEFDFDFSSLGDFINNTVQSALAGLENIGDAIDFDFTPKMARIKVQPGTNIRFDSESVVPEEALPNLDEVNYGKEILRHLQNQIASLETLSTQLHLDQSALATSLEQLKEKKLVIQEKYGAQRFMVTKLGKKVLKKQNNQDTQNNEETNN